MKKFLSILAIVLTATTVALGQAPGIFNYQGVARNSVGNVLVNKTITLRLTIHDGAAAGPTVYQESRTVITNPFGLFNVQVGSPGASVVTGTVAGVPWGVGAKFIQVEIDPNGGTAFINIGTAQIASVPYSLYATTAGDLVLPYLKTQADAGTLFRINNSGTGVSGAIMGTTSSNAANAWGVHGQVNNTSAGGFSSGILGTNLSTSGLGIGVTGRQSGGGWGVYGFTPSGRGVFGESTTGIGLYGSTTSGKALFTSGGVQLTGINEALNRILLSDATGNATWQDPSAAGIVTGSGTLNFVPKWTPNGTNLGNSKIFDDGTFVGIGTSTPGAGLVVSGNGIWNSAIGIQNTGTGMEWRMNVSGTTFGITKIPGSTFTPFQLFSTGGLDFSNSAGTSIMRLLDNGNVGLGISAPTRRLHVVGGVNITDGTQANNFVLRSDATGNASWVDPAVLLPGANFWSRVGTNLFATNLGDNVGVGTNTPTHKFTVSHGGSTGISVSSTSGFSVVDINAASGDAALRFGNNGTNQWNIRNRPADDYLEIFELGGGGSRMVIQDATGNVGIGETANPTYKLDVLHGGSTGIRSRSSGSFSVVDIDAASGDAALRFQKAGAGQWNTRNRPADDYYEIFELGGGGSRLVIQDATGNVGIGETTNPSYKLDVLHGGSTGARIRSTASFSVLDIDAASGDAALRFANAGVNQWNIRNRPADDYLEIFELGGGGSRVVIQDGSGNVGIGETVNPIYKLDVLHGGATGIRSRSSGSFSVVDIDAASGDAALRFANAGVNQWNVRNRPADDYFEIFELGGGGSRVVIQDGSGNVGIGETVNPTYKLDVLHGGATGIRSRSSGTFSVIDIDAANGDAALRFQKAGVNMWNIRNRPADDAYEIFELGGGGSRMIIQNGSGNVGIGQTSNPVYKLDVLHAGATGLRVQSSATFSIIDIDGQNGDAAIRFAKAGVNQWNIRNNPATDDLQFFELGGGGERMRIENTTGNVAVTGNLSKGGGAFKIDHPLDPANKYLYHSFVESPDMMNIYNGNITTDASGKAIVKLPDYFEALNMEFRYQLTVIGSFAQAIVNKEVTNNAFEIATNQPGVKVSWQVTGVRHDAYANQNRIPNSVPKEKENVGKYLHPKAFNQPVSKSIGYDNKAEGTSSLNTASPVTTTKTAPATSGGSLDQGAIVPPVVNSKVNEKGTSLEQATVVGPVINKTAEKGGSVENITVPKTDKPAPANKGGSLDEMPKPVENKKPATTDPGSTKTE